MSVSVSRTVDSLGITGFHMGAKNGALERNMMVRYGAEYSIKYYINKK